MKFKIWDVENKKFVSYGVAGSDAFDYREWCIRSDGVVGWISKHGYLQDGGLVLIPIFSIGVRDKNGVELFEGDYVKDEFGDQQEITYDKKLGCWFCGEVLLFEKSYGGHSIIEKTGSKYDGQENC